LFAAACASATIGEAQMDGGPDGGDDVSPQADAGIAPDGGAVTVTLQSGSSNTITPDNSVSCNSNSPDYFHAENRYFRKYTLTDLGITGDLVVSSVDIGIQEATSPAGTQPVRLSLYTLEGPFLLANLTPLGARNLDVANQTLQVLNVPIEATVPAGSTLVVEVLTPDGQPASNRFFIGSNNEVETQPSYILAPSGGCAIPEPTEISQLGIPDLLMSLVLNVTGEHTSL
jgi:hypothetical protein